MGEVNLENMTYQEFLKYCNDRAADGQWSILEAMACTDIINKIESVKVKGFFKKKETMKAREAAWKEYDFKSIS